VHPKQSDWDQFYAHLKQKTGLNLHDYKQQQMQRRILSMLEAREATDLTTFWKSLTADPKGIEWFLDKMAINTSELYRNPEKWVEMRSTILPSLLQGKKSLKCWSAGCSIGAEAYTLASILDAYFPGTHTILCSDIDKAALAQARSGRYGQFEMKCVPDDIRKKYFSEQDGQFEAKPSLKKYLKFEECNLLNDRFQTGFDLIMCRNVVIYFTEEAKNVLYERFNESLNPGGVLFVGCTERIGNARALGLESSLPFFYQKQNSGDQKWRNAS